MTTLLSGGSRSTSPLCRHPPIERFPHPTFSTPPPTHLAPSRSCFLPFLTGPPMSPHRGFWRRQSPEDCRGSYAPFFLLPTRHCLARQVCPILLVNVEACSALLPRHSMSYGPTVEPCYTGFSTCLDSPLSHNVCIFPDSLDFFLMFLFSSFAVSCPLIRFPLKIGSSVFLQLILLRDYRGLGDLYSYMMSWRWQ